LPCICFFGRGNCQAEPLAENFTGGESMIAPTLRKGRSGWGTRLLVCEGLILLDSLIPFSGPAEVQILSPQTNLHPRDGYLCGPLNFQREYGVHNRSASVHVEDLA